jgi:hypothetical protein
MLRVKVEDLGEALPKFPDGIQNLTLSLMFNNQQLTATESVIGWGPDETTACPTCGLDLVLERSGLSLLLLRELKPARSIRVTDPN